MGISPFSHWNESSDPQKTEVHYHHYHEIKNEPEEDKRNPNIFVFKIEKIIQINRFTIVQIRYPNCTNYEGRKILMWHGHTKKSITDLKAIDPHFSDSVYSPIARFEPTIRGWKMAEKLAKEGF